MKKSYQIEKGPDGILWVSIQPLQEDVRDAIDQVMAIDTSRATDAQKQIVEMRLIGLRSIHEFLGALIMEKQLEEARKDHKFAEPSPDLVSAPITRSH